MHHDDISEQLADYLSGEMDAAARRGFETQLAHDPALAAEVQSLRGALRQMRRLEQVQTSAPGNAVKAAWPRRSPPGAALRYAAAAAMAFAAGWLMHGPGAADTTNPSPPTVAFDSPPLGAPDSTAARFATAYAMQRGESSLARSLGALAQIHRGD